MKTKVLRQMTRTEKIAFDQTIHPGYRQTNKTAILEKSGHHPWKRR